MAGTATSFARGGLRRGRAPRRALALSLALVGGAAACASPGKLLCASPVAAPSPSPSASPTPVPVDVKFLGVGGFLITRGKESILTAPLFSNPGFFKVGLGKIGPDRKRVRDGLRRVGVSDEALQRVRAILVGHAHYDHLMDVPALCPLAPRAVVYGNASVGKILRAFAEREDLRCPRIESLEDRALGWGDDVQPDSWTTVIEPSGEGGGVRVLPLKSEHSAQFELPGLRFGFWEGGSPEHERAPTRANDWGQGLPLAYLIDFLDREKKPVFRIYYSDSATCSPCGYVPKALAERGDTRPVDLALLTGGGSETMADYPAGFLRNTCARDVLIGHWENFFKPYEGPKKLEMLGGAEALLTRLGALGKDACLPQPGTTFSYLPGPPAEACAFPAWNTGRECGCRVAGTGACEPPPKP